MSFGIYLVGYIILIAGLAIGANILNVPLQWIGVGDTLYGRSGDRPWRVGDATKGSTVLGVAPWFASAHSTTDGNCRYLSFCIGPMAVRAEQSRCPNLSSPKLLPQPATNR